MMAAEASLLPMDISSLLDQDPTGASAHNLQNDPFLQELFTNNEGVSRGLNWLSPRVFFI